MLPYFIGRHFTSSCLGLKTKLIIFWLVSQIPGIMLMLILLKNVIYRQREILNEVDTPTEYCDVCENHAVCIPK